MRSPTEMAHVLRAHGRKVTPQRLCIVRILHGSDEHLTAEAIHERAVVELPTISLRTVYQTLHELAEIGELAALDLGTGSTRFDPTTAPHHHLVCDGCGAVRDVFVDASIPLPALPATEAAGFTVRTTEIVFRGRCDECASVHHA